jgi:hypothetical protein
MEETTKNASGQRAANKSVTDRGEGAMSPSMRELILSFVSADSERTWDADAYTRSVRKQME